MVSARRASTSTRTCAQQVRIARDADVRRRDAPAVIAASDAGARPQPAAAHGRASRRTHRPAQPWPCRIAQAAGRRPACRRSTTCCRVLGAGAAHLLLRRRQRRAVERSRPRAASSVWCGRQPALPVEPGRRGAGRAAARPGAARSSVVDAAVRRRSGGRTTNPKPTRLDADRPRAPPSHASYRSSVVRACRARRRRAAKWRRTRPGRAPRAAPTRASTPCRAASRPPARRQSSPRSAPSWRAAPACRRRRGGRAAAPDQAGATPSQRQAAVPVGVPGRTGAGADHERRVADDEVERARRATGSSRSPCRRSSRTSDSAAVSPASCSARGESRWPTTWSLCRLACRACTPQPVPTSRARPTADARVSWASMVEAPPTPRTWSVRQRAAGAVEAGAEVGDDPPGSCAVVASAVRAVRRPDVRRRAPRRRRRTSSPEVDRGVQRQRRAVAACWSTGSWSRNSRTRVSSGTPPVVARRAGTVSSPAERRGGRRARAARRPRRPCSRRRAGDAQPHGRSAHADAVRPTGRTAVRPARPARPAPRPTAIGCGAWR